MAFVVLALLLSVPALAQQAGDWAALDAQAEGAYNRGDLPGAIRTAQEAVAAAANPKQTGHSIDRLGFFQYTSGDLKAGEASLRKGPGLRRTHIRADRPDYARS